MKTPSTLLVLAAAVATIHSSAAQRVDYAQLLFERYEPFVIRSSATSSSSLCLSTSGNANSPSSTPFTAPMVFAECGESLTSQSFVFDAVTGQLQPPAHHGYCVDSGGGSGETHSSSSSFRLQVCSTSNTNQQFAFDLTTGQITSATGLCLDSSSGYPSLVPCTSTASSQRFGVVAAKEIEPRSTTYVSTPNGLQIAIPELFAASKPFLFVAKHKSNLCLSDGGDQQLNGNTTFEVATCGADASAQTFVFDPATLQIKSVAREGLCVNDGKGEELPPFLHLEQCDPTDENQRWVLDESTDQLLNPSYPTMCVDDGGGLLPGQTKVYLDWCSDANSDQFFELQPTSYSPPTVSTFKKNK